MGYLSFKTPQLRLWLLVAASASKPTPPQLQNFGASVMIPVLGLLAAMAVPACPAIYAVPWKYFRPDSFPSGLTHHTTDKSLLGHDPDAAA
jgi:hypothetical protein